MWFKVSFTYLGSSHITNRKNWIYTLPQFFPAYYIISILYSNTKESLKLWINLSIYTLCKYWLLFGFWNYTFVIFFNHQITRNNYALILTSVYTASGQLYIQMTFSLNCVDKIRRSLSGSSFGLLLKLLNFDWLLYFSYTP